ncbi:hypothetical protein FOZ62_016182, partial [Perkinsus olseni]
MDSSSTPEKASPSTSSTSPEAGLGAFIEEVVRKSVTEALKVYRTPPSVAANPKTPSTVSSPAKAHTAGVSLSGPYDRPKPKAVSVRDSKVSGSPKKTSSVSHITPISQLKPDNSMCTFEGRAVSKSRLTSYGQHKGSLFSVEVIDGSGGVRITFYDKAAEEYYTRIDVPNVYVFTGRSSRPSIYHLRVASSAAETCYLHLPP